MKQALVQTHAGKRAALSAIAVIAAIALALALMSLAGTARAYASDYQAGSITTQSKEITKGTTFKKNGNTYKVIDYEPYDDDSDWGEVKLVKYRSTDRHAVVNTVTYKGIKFEVDVIGNGAFNNARGHKVTSVKIGKHVDSIHANAFLGCKNLRKLNMIHTDVVDIERSATRYYVEEINIGANAFKNAGVPGLVVSCGKKNTQYQSVFKKALMKKGLRSDAVIVQ